MKKYLLFFASLVMVAGAYSQAYEVLLSQSFNGSATGWTTTDNNNSGVTWAYQHNNIESPYFGPISFIDSSQNFNFAVAICSGIVNTDLNSPVINCSGQTGVLLQWTQWFAYYGNADGIVEISTNGTNWTTIYDVLHSSTGANDELVDLDISQYAANQSTVYLKFNYSTTNTDIFWAINDLTVSTYPANDIAVTAVNEAPVTGISNQYQVNCTFMNMGSTAINNLTLNYSINGSVPVSESVTIPGGLSSLQTYPYTFQTMADISQPGTYPVLVYSTLPNGETDDNPSNDSSTLAVMFLGSIPEKNVLVEEYTTSPCGFCPGGATNLDEIIDLDTFAIPVALHTGFDPQQDPFSTEDMINFGNAFNEGASPLACIDRVFFPNNDLLATGINSLCNDASVNDIIKNDDWLAYTNERRQQISPVAIYATNRYDSSTRELNVSVFTTFYGAMTGDFRVSCYILEDSLFGTQLSYYYMGTTNPNGNPWYNVGTFYQSSSPSGCGEEALISNYLYNYVVRDFIGSNWGWGTPGFGSGITTTSIDSQYVLALPTYTLPTEWNANHVSLVVFVDEYNSNLTSGQDQVLNSVKMKLNSTAQNSAPEVVLTSVDNVPGGTDKVSLYPNPATNQVYINYSIDAPGRVGFAVYNSMGQLVSVLNEASLGEGSYTSVINTESFANGLYFLTMKRDNVPFQTTKFVVSR